MSAYKTLVIAIDLEGGYDQILSKVAELVKDHQAKLIIVNVGHFPIPTYAGVYGAGIYVPKDFYLDYEDIRKKLMPELEGLANEYGLSADSVQVEFGRPADMIVDVANNEAADLIVIGSHGKHGIGLLLGSTANAVLHHAKCDVLAVRIHK